MLAPFAKKGKGPAPTSLTTEVIKGTTERAQALSTLPNSAQVKNALVEIGGRPENSVYIKRILDDTSSSNVASVLSDFKKPATAPKAVVTETVKPVETAKTVTPKSADMATVPKQPTLAELIPSKGKSAVSKIEPVIATKTVATSVPKGTTAVSSTAKTVTPTASPATETAVVPAADEIPKNVLKEEFPVTKIAPSRDSGGNVVGTNVSGAVMSKAAREK